MNSIHCDPDQKACNLETKLHGLATQFETTRILWIFKTRVITILTGNEYVVLLLLDYLNFVEGTTSPPPTTMLCLLPPL